MTRETKAGLVVSCSFLCLVGAVVAVKLRQHPAEVALVDPATDPPETKSSGPPSTDPPSPPTSIPNSGKGLEQPPSGVPPLPTTTRDVAPPPTAPAPDAAG